MGRPTHAANTPRATVTAVAGSSVALTSFPDNSVSVIVLNYRRAETTLECLRALRRSPSTLLREIVLVDNGSDQGTVDLLRASADGKAVRLVAVGANRYFGEGNNIGAEEATGEYLVFLNNDAFVQPGWLGELARPMIDDHTVAAVGALLTYPDGRVQEVGGLVLPTGDVVQIGKGAIWGPDHYTDAFPVDYCSASCLLVRKRDFEAVGGFSYEYEPAYYEDTDLCLKLWARVGRVVVNPRARVIHLESHTTSDRSLELDGIVELNRQKFLATWGEWLGRRSVRGTVLDAEPTRGDGSWADAHAPEVLANDHRGPAGSDRGGRCPTTRQPSPGAAARTPVAAIYTPYELVPGGGERFLLELCSHLSAVLGEDRVVLTTPHRYSTMRIMQLGRAFGFDQPVAVPKTFDTIEGSDLEVGIVIGNAVVPSIRSFARRNIYLCQFPFVTPDTYVDERRAWLEGFDEVWVYSDFTRRYMSGFAGHYGLDCPPIRVIYPPATWPQADRGRPWPERRTILTVGRFFTEGHDKRQDVVIDVVRDLVARGHHIDVALAGSVHTTASSRARFRELVEMASGLPSRFYPNAARHQLASLYRDAAVLVHAAGYGLDPHEYPERLEHFGIVPVEAASFGCIPVVYGEGGPAEVISLLGTDTTFHTREECVARIAELLDNPTDSAALSETVRDRVEQFSSASFRARVSHALGELGVQGAW